MAVAAYGTSPEPRLLADGDVGARSHIDATVVSLGRSPWRDCSQYPAGSRSGGAAGAVSPRGICDLALGEH